MDGDPFEESDPASTKKQREQVLEVARQRPATNVAKSIVAYEEQPDLSILVVLLEEISKNSDYSTDLRLSTEYYGNHLLRLCKDRNVPRRVALGCGGSAIQSLGKIYADRVEYIGQTTEHINESMSSAQREASEKNTSGQESSAPKPEEPRKRRVKKLAQKTIDPFLVNLEPRAFKTMSEEKRFSTTGMAKCSRNRTIEYLYQDHTPPNLWRNAPIVDPRQASEIDEKKQYKLFTYHIEHRYNTLLPDIQFERLSLIKEYVNSQNLSQDILNVHMTTDEFLSEYIALENQMLASRYGATVRARSSGSMLAETMKRTLEAVEIDASCNKKPRTEDEAMEALDSSIGTMPEEVSEPMEVNETLNPREKLQTLNSSDSGLGMTLDITTLDSSKLESAALSASLVEGPALSSTLLPATRNESSILDTADSEMNALTIGCEKPKVFAGLSSDDEGVVLSDIDERRLQSLSPKVMVRDILPGVPNKDTVTVLIDDEMRALVGITEDEPPERPPTFVEEVVTIPIEVCYPLEFNIFGIPEARLRRRNLFKLPTDFDLFKKARIPTKRDAEPKPPKAVRLLTPAIVEYTEESATGRERNDPMRLSLEFDLDNNFLGFRRPTHDSGVDDMRYDSRPISVETLLGFSEPTDGDEGPADDKKLVAAALDKCDSGLDATQLEVEANESANVDGSGLNDTQTDKAVLPVNATQLEAAALPANGQANGDDSGLDATQLDAAAMSADDQPKADVPALDTTQPDAGASVPANDQTNLDDSGLGTTQIDSILSSLNINEAPTNPSRPGSAMAHDDWRDDANSTHGSDLGVDNPFRIDKGGFSDSSDLVRDWHIKIAPMLEVAHERQNFKFEDLGTEIIETCQQGHGRATLADVMQGKDNTTMGRHFFASLKLLNDGNIVLKNVDRDKSKPIDISEYKMQLMSTERKQVHPEDDIGNLNVVKTKPAADKKRLKRKSTEVVPVTAEAHVKMVRLIEAIPKVSQSRDDGDSGISSMASSAMWSEKNQ
ncbi:uncharacterized protein Cap-H2 isoform X1 [Drosophila pseudoobscura]|uniref:Uncharacterized protein Cap-H2 isoform X1 n=2 Tax=Drosophila pseudoobscura pseudoobscura TaxID=46245 RepID=A0A6I8VCJ1_DROPS|nr:uncharacterized protein LOC4803223 isoform X1 [Drosophila pseudoobscura]